LLPQHIHHLAIRPGRAAPTRLYPIKDGADSTPEVLPQRYVVAHELTERLLGVVQLELAALEEGAGIEIVVTQAREEKIEVGGGRDHDDSIAAPQARLQVQRDGIREGLRVAVQLSEVSIDRSFDQQRTDERRSHLNPVGEVAKRDANTAG
jgi:hypothetical protein